MDRNPKASTTSLFSAGAEVHPELEPNQTGVEISERGQAKAIFGWVEGIVYDTWKFGRSFHADPGMSPDSLFGTTPA